MEVGGLQIREQIINKQFEIIRSKDRIKDIPEDGVVIVGKKRKWWHDVYLFTEEEEKQWLEWAYDTMKDSFMDPEKEIRYIELRWGFARSLKKEGSLF